jgi:ArsR family transcriptional regulator, arsenate/arsenite/antimonite-responsive transcriptional repressor / arsenate reductase (thioredoxin)
LSSLMDPPSLVVTVCDRAHEELPADMSRLHWSIPDPVGVGTAAAFDATVAELRERIGALTSAAAA